MRYERLLVAAAMLHSPACSAGDAPLGPTSAEISRTYLIDTYDLVRCVTAAIPELRDPASGWIMTYTDTRALIAEIGHSQIAFRPVSELETEVHLSLAEGAYRLFHPGTLMATIEACGLGERFQAPLAAPLLPPPEVRRYRSGPVRSRM